ncbi:MAG: Probable poly(beta-D-mannuronate) O-acetylase (EC [uncultured Sulfurovum sp.]|uniref:Probable poly(Beta-D-mannuronate) O-acetylase (EC) n=1 Tax=uncultured Sulfurovum sp. TaxID=269237 RepID=A0A6S6T278_9BACT|nr:MAG: Probable poly(beta-D-mannuronate) O-acetylase (EC [uncultured Sulfurovum sp.]
MLFNSYLFIFTFLPLTFFLYFFLLEKRLIVGAKGLLIFGSLFFYSWWDIAYLPLILSSMLFNYMVGNSLNENFKKVKIHKKSLLIFGIIGNISLLGYFKYTDFLIENFNFAFDGSVPLLHLALPLAISFFTFQQIAYLVDSYRRETAEYDFLNYALFVTFFPQLIAGPIVHHSEMMPQFASKWNLVKKYKNIALGIFIFSMGLFKKVVIADTFAVWATKGFDTLEILTFVEAWVTSLSYTFQLYFDFSGYTDMAIGTALLFNIKLPINFNSPYKALDIQDFWRRWHITLSRFLRDYIYIPLGGNRKGSLRTYVNLMATFILGGIWHGAGWTFVFWGFLHGLALVIHRLWESLGFTMPKFLAWFITFNFINIAWVFFRAKEWSDATKVLKGMFLTTPELATKLSVLSSKEPSEKLYIFLSLALIISLFIPNSMQWRVSFKGTTRYMVVTAVTLLFSMYFMHRPTEFLYFNF